MKKLILVLILMFSCFSISFAGRWDDSGGGAAGVENDVYGAGWNGDTTNAPSQNAIYDKIETILGASGLLDLGSVTAFSDADETPDISSGNLFKTANNGATIIRDFDAGAGALTTGHEFVVIIDDDNTTIDFTATTLKGHGLKDWNPVKYDRMSCVYDGTNFLCEVSSFSEIGINVDGMWQCFSIDPTLLICDGTGSEAAASDTINAGPTIYSVKTTDADNNCQFSYAAPENWDGQNVYVKMLGHSKEVTPSGTMEFEVKGMARGDDEVIDNTWVAAVNLQFGLTIDTRYDEVQAESAVLDLNGGTSSEEVFMHIHRDYDDGTNCTSTQDFYINKLRLCFQVDSLNERD